MSKLKIYKTDEFFNEVVERLRAEGFYPDFLDYSLADKYSAKEIKNIEFDIVAETIFGSSEGIYTHIMMKGNWGNDDTPSGVLDIGTFKTLKKDDETFLKMSELGARFQLASRIWITEHENYLSRTGYRVDMYASAESEKSGMALICPSFERAESNWKRYSEYSGYRRAIITDMLTRNVVKEYNEDDVKQYSHFE